MWKTARIASRSRKFSVSSVQDDSARLSGCVTTKAQAGKVATDGSILFVCRANVCRSPVAEFVAIDRLSGSGLDVLSAGTDAAPGNHLCTHAAGMLAGRDRDLAFVSTHRSRRLSTKLIGNADLILTASIRERSLVARLDPEARPRTFTIVEFDRLLSILPTVSGPATLSAVVAQVHQQRWRATSEHWREPAILTRLNPLRARDGLNLRDAHTVRNSIHGPILAETRSRVGAVSDSLMLRLPAMTAKTDAKPDTAILPTDDSRHAV